MGQVVFLQEQEEFRLECCVLVAPAPATDAAAADRRELKGIPAVVKIAPPRTVLI
jgi:hypothetical protein